MDKPGTPDDLAGRHRADRASFTGPELLSEGSDSPRTVVEQYTDLVREATEHAAAQAAQAPAAAEEAARKVTRRWVIWVVMVAALLPLIVSLFTASYVAQDRANRDAADAAREALDAQTRESVDTALKQLGQFNDTLRAQGKPPVAATDDPAQAIAAVVLARVLAQLPRQPDAAQLEEAVRQQVLSGVSADARSQVANAVADYFAANRGELRGEPPSPAQVQAAVDAALQANPPRQGPAGRDGAQGTQGVQGERGEQGIGGERGEKGDRGDQGDPGLPGEPPVGWTVQEANGSTTTCSRSGVFDPAAPTYTCVNDGPQDPTTDPGPEPEPEQQSVAPTPTAPAPPATSTPLAPPLPLPTT